MPTPPPPQISQLLPDDEGRLEDVVSEPTTLQDTDFHPQIDLSEAYRLTQGVLYGLVRDLNLPKDKTELLGSRLKKWNLLSPDVKVSLYRDRQEGFMIYFKKENNIVASVMLMIS